MGAPGISGFKSNANVSRLRSPAETQPRLVLERGNVERLSPRVRETMLDEAIETIPYELIKAFLSKPFSQEDLHEEIRQCLQ